MSDEKDGFALLAEMTEGCFVPPSAVANRLTDAERAVLAAAEEWRDAEKAEEAKPVGERGDEISLKHRALDKLRSAADALRPEPAAEEG